jgi:hypothetical protein
LKGFLAIAMPITTDKMAAARSFVRSLNILLKFARLYNFDHTRTAAQFETAWKELRSAIPAGEEGGLLLGASGSQLLLDGAPLEGEQAERNFAQLLSAAGVASIQFLPQLKRGELEQFVRAFPAGHAKASDLGEQLKSAMAGATGIRVNEIRFVAEDASTAEFRLAASLTAKTLGANANQIKEWLSDPQKLLQLIAAAEGSRGRTGAASSAADGGNGSASGDNTAFNATPTSGPAADTGAVSGERSGAAGTGAGAGSHISDDEITNMFHLVTRIVQTAGGEGGPGVIQQELESAPERTRTMMQQALAALAAQAPAGKSDRPMLLRLAEHLAIRFALDRYERGEVRVNAVREMIDRMSQEITALREILGGHEERMAQAGIVVESQADLLDRQFWAAVPESGKRNVLTSPEAWCVPPRNVRQYVQELVARGDHAAAGAALDNYSAALSNEDDANARRRAAIGLADLADLYAASQAPVLEPAIQRAAAQLSLERDAELQGLVCAAFVRLAQESALRRNYRAVLQALDCIDSIENQRPTFAQTVRPRLGLEQRLADFIGEAARSAPQFPEHLIELLDRAPGPVAQDLTKRFNRSTQRAERESIFQVAEAVGPQVLSHLSEFLMEGQPNEAADCIGLLLRLDPSRAETTLKRRLVDWSQLAQDRALRLIAGSGASQRGQILLSVFDQFDPLLQPLAMDEIGMSREKSSINLLMYVASAAGKSSPFLRLKAVEALGRLRAAEAAEHLRDIVESKKLWQWQHPAELRLAAYLALRNITPAWAREFFPRSGFNEDDIFLGPRDASAEQVWSRQRRHLRVRLKTVLPAAATSGQEIVSLQVRSLSLSGGLASGERHITPGTLVTLRLGTGLRPIRAQAFMRGARAQALSFEFAEMDLEDRARLRRLLRENGPLLPGASDATTAEPAPETFKTPA